MKTILRSLLTLFIAVLSLQVGTAQTVKEPTIDGTLDVRSQQEGLVIGQDYLWQAYIKGFDRVGDKVNLQIKLENPAQRDNFKLLYNSNRDATTEDEAVYSEVVFDENGLATIGPEGGESLIEDSKEYFKINFTEAGTYNYDLVLRRADGNDLVTTTETVRVRSDVTGIDDMIGESKVAVYPTISDGLVRLNLGKIRNAKVAVIDVLGRTVLEVNKANGVVDISTQGYAKGTYFIKVFADNDVASSRLVVK